MLLRLQPRAWHTAAPSPGRAWAALRTGGLPCAQWAVRLGCFKVNVKLIIQKATACRGDWLPALYSSCDWCWDEKKQNKRLWEPSKHRPADAIPAAWNKPNLTYWNWRRNGYVTPAKQQGMVRRRHRPPPATRPSILAQGYPRPQHACRRRPEPACASMPRARAPPRPRPAVRQLLGVRRHRGHRGQGADWAGQEVCRLCPGPQ